MVGVSKAPLETTLSVYNIPNRELAIARVHNLLTISGTLSNAAVTLTTHPLARSSTLNLTPGPKYVCIFYLQEYDSHCNICLDLFSAVMEDTG